MIYDFLGRCMFVWMDPKRKRLGWEGVDRLAWLFLGDWYILSVRYVCLRFLGCGMTLNGKG